jgi:hypothetical protein
VLVEGLRRRHVGAVVNALAAVAVTFLPTVVERRFGVEVRPWQRLYTETAMLAHAAGMLGPYEAIWWWDHLTHTLSASILGGVVHAAAERRDRDSQWVVVVATVVGGLVWEAFEYGVHSLTDTLGVDPVLVPYSARDTLLDLGFDAVGAALVVVLGDRLLDNLTWTDG